MFRLGSFERKSTVAFWQCLDKIELLLIPTSSHTGWNTAILRSILASFIGTWHLTFITIRSIFFISSVPPPWPGNSIARFLQVFF